jgi:rod shape-determining protein MreC
MKVFPHFIDEYKEYFVLAICLIISLILIFSNSARQIDALRVLTLDLMGNFQVRFGSLNKSARLGQEVSFLREQNTMLALENSKMREAIVENRRLRKLIGFKESHPYNLLAVKVKGGNFTGYMNHILLDAGRKDNICKNMPIVLPSGLVGKIFEVGEKTSIGHILFDQNFRVSAKVQRSGVKGIIGWTSGKYNEFREVSNRSDVKVGDKIVTSGYSEIFPEGIFIGKVVSIEDTKRDLFMNVKVKPEIAFNKLEEVLIILNQNNAIK